MHTVTAQVSEKPPAAVVTTILAVPTVTPVTTPSALTVATDGFVEAQLTLLSGCVVTTRGCKANSAPTLTLAIGRFSETPALPNAQKPLVSFR